MDTNEVMDLLAKEMLAYHDRIREVVKNIPDAELPAIAAHVRTYAKPNEHKSFAVPEWDEVADIIEGEYGIRVHLKKAEEHFAKTGEGVYCLHCGGSCTPEHLKEMGGL